MDCNLQTKMEGNLKFTPSFPPSFEGENCINYTYAINVGLLNHTGSTSLTVPMLYLLRIRRQDDEAQLIP